jgi:cytochrome c oxidase subunit 1
VYNFANIPRVTSRYPLWDVKSPQLTSDVPHWQQGDREVAIDVGGVDQGRAGAHAGGAPPDRMAGVRVADASRVPTAEELGIPIPYTTTKPFFTALGITIMLSGLLFSHLDNKVPEFTILFSGAAILVGSLYWWLTSPLEPEVAHEHAHSH